MTLRINTNIAAMRGVRHLESADRNLAESLLRLSSGFKINKAADDPAGLIISEQMRGQISGLNQAIANSELATSMVQTAEASLNEANNLLIRMRQLALHAANTGGNDPGALEADQQELSDALETLSRIGRTTQFGTRTLLDGSAGTSGAAQGEGLSFVSATEKTRSSPVDGFVVEVDRVATRAFLEGDEELDEDTLPGLQVTLFESGRTVQVEARDNDTAGSFAGRLRDAVERGGLNLDVFLTPDDRLLVVQRGYGSEKTFQAASSVEDVLSEEAGMLQAAVPGQDVAGTINGEAAQGQGQLLRGLKGNESTEGLTVRYSGPLVVVDEQGPEGEPVVERRPRTGVVGTVNVFNNALDFQIGPNAGQTVTFAFPQVDPRFMARDVENRSDFGSLAQIDVTSQQGAQDSLKLIDAAIDQLTLTRGRLGAFQRDALESNLNTLRVTAENLMAAESTIRDTDMARELAEFTRRRIQVETAAAMTAQANQVPGQVIRLLQP